MKGPPTGFWAKLERDPACGVVDWHSIEDHSADVAACLEAMLDQPVWRKRIAAVAGIDDLTNGQRARLCVLAALHDVGKYNAGFQRKDGRGGPTSGHVREVLSLFVGASAATRQLSDAIGFAEIERWTVDPLAAGELLIAAICHHGRPLAIGGPQRAAWWKNELGVDRFAAIAKLAQAAREWFPGCQDTSSPPLPASHALQHAFSGLVMLADWLGSDTRFFPFGQQGDGARIDFARVQAGRAVRSVGLDVGAARRSLGDRTPTIADVIGGALRPEQAAVAALDECHQGGITVLEAATGAGKTEAALGRYLTLFWAGQVDGLYFALPTRTAATQIYRRVNEAVRRLFPDADARPTVVLAVPGYLELDGVTGARLADFRVLWNDSDSERWRYRGWAAEHPKRFLAGAVVVGTIDQVLLSALAVPHAHLRASALIRHLLVVDEVHASDFYMTRVLQEVLRRHLRAGGHALLMSATLTDEARRRLLAPDRAPTPRPLDRALDVAFPLVAHRALPSADITERAPSSSRQGEVQVQLASVAGQPSAIAERAAEAARAGAKVLVLRNTVADCLATQAALEGAGASGQPVPILQCSGVQAPHHSRYAGGDRRALDAAIEGAFGKQRPAGGVVAVATQTVQQSLDLDADLMLTDLCPMDVLLQRVGRLHRHDRPERPRGFEKPQLVVLVPERRELSELLGGDGVARGPHGLGTVYEDLRIIEATWRRLERCNTWRLPEQCRELVETSLHSDVLHTIAAELGERWQRHETKVLGVAMAHATTARLNLARWDVGFSDPAVQFPDREQLEARIGTRLGEADRLARFDRPPQGPFGAPIGELSIPAHLARDVPADAVTGDLDSWEGGFSFGLGPHRYHYDRLGLRHDDFDPLGASQSDERQGETT